MAINPEALGAINDIGTYSADVRKPFDFAPAAIKAGGGLLESIANIVYNEISYNRNKKMFYEQRAYNEPIMQMSRLKQAGLNPNLVYGSGNAIHQSPQPAQSSAVPVDLTSSVSVLQDYMVFKNQQMDLALKHAQNDLIRQKILTEQENTLMRNLNNQLNSSSMADQQVAREYKWKIMLQQLFNLEKDWDIKFWDESIKSKQREWMDEGIPITGGDKFLQYFKFGQEQFKKYAK